MKNVLTLLIAFQVLAVCVDWDWMQNRLKVFLLLTFLHFGKKWLFFSWNVLSALTQQETSHLCKSPSLLWGSYDPAGVQRWRETPPRGRGGLAWSRKLFYLCAFRIASYFPTFVSALFHLWLWVSEVKGSPRASCQGTQAKEAFCTDSPGGPSEIPAHNSSPGLLHQNPDAAPKHLWSALARCLYVLQVSSLWPWGSSASLGPFCFRPVWKCAL